MKVGFIVIMLQALSWTEIVNSQQNNVVIITINTTVNLSCNRTGAALDFQSWICGSLMEGLSLISDGSTNTEYTVQLLSNSHQVNNSTGRLHFESIYTLNFFGTTSPTEIVCNDGSGFYFQKIYNMKVHNVSFCNCSELRPSIYNSLYSTRADTLLIALAFVEITDTLELMDVQIHILEGAVAVALYNMNTVNIISCTFNRSAMSGQLIGEEYSVSSTLLVEFTFCREFDDTAPLCSNSNRNNRNGGVFLITDSNISYNYAVTDPDISYNHASDQKDSSLNPTGYLYSLVGKGGGLAIVVKGDCQGNYFTINNTNFTSNMANQGSGLYIAFMDGTNQNQVIISNSNFTGNGKLDVTPEKLSHLYNAGGGICIDNWVSSIVVSNSGPNQVTILNSTFDRNKAHVGGGIFLNSLYFNGMHTLILLIKSCNFTKNKAKIGSALYIIQSNATKFDDSVNVTFQNIKLVNNFIINLKSVSSAGYGAIYCNMVSLNFIDAEFRGNNGSALVVVNSYVSFSRNNSFSKNTGLQGGAMALLGSSYIFLYSGTALFFSNNVASYRGGALYKHYPEHIIYDLTPCFVQQQDPIHVTFNNNTLQNGKTNSIHATSTIPCGIDNNTLLGSSWSYYSSDKSSQITTDFDSYKTIELKKSAMISPGRKFSVSFDLVDDLGRNTTLSDQTFIVTKTPAEGGISKTNLTTSDQLRIEGGVNKSFHLMLDSIGIPTLHVQFDVILSECPFGFINGSGRCGCSSNFEFQGFVNCTESDRNIAILDDGGWIGLYENKTVVATCPLFFCKTKRGGLELPKHYTEELSSLICTGNRKGLLCSECIENYRPTINSWQLECINCTDTTAWKAVLTFLTAVYFPYAVMMAIIIIFNLRLSSGPASTLVMYSQMVTTTFDASIHGLINIYPETALNTYRYIYGPLNLDFIENIIPSMCFPIEHTILASFGLNYLLVVVPMTIIAAAILMAVIAKKYKLTFKPIVRFWKVLKDRNLFKFSPRSHTETLFLAVTTIITLSFLKICISSALILSTSTLITIDNKTVNQKFVTFAADLNVTDWRYSIYQAPAIIAEITAIVFIILLMDFPLRLMEYFIHRSSLLSKVYPETVVHLFMSAFNGMYKKKFRIFAGLSFLMRYCFSLVFVNPTKNYTKFTLQSISCFLMILLLFFCWPYKNVKHNYIDLFILSNLLILNGLGFYQYVNYFISPVSGRRVTLLLFSIQYIFTVVPLICLVCYCIYRLTKHKHEEWSEDFRNTASGLVKKWSPELHEKIFEVDHEEDEGIEDRPSSSARISNNRLSPPTARGLLTGKTSLNWSTSDEIEVDHTPAVPVTVIGVTDKHEGEATTYQTSQSEGYFLRSDWNPVSYGSINNSLNTEKRRKSRK